MNVNRIIQHQPCCYKYNRFHLPNIVGRHQKMSWFSCKCLETEWWECQLETICGSGSSIYFFSSIISCYGTFVQPQLNWCQVSVLYLPLGLHPYRICPLDYTCIVSAPWTTPVLYLPLGLHIYGICPLDYTYTVSAPQQAHVLYLLSASQFSFLRELKIYDIHIIIILIICLLQFNKLTS